MVVLFPCQKHFTNIVIFHIRCKNYFFYFRVLILVIFFALTNISNLSDICKNYFFLFIALLFLCSHKYSEFTYTKQVFFFISVKKFFYLLYDLYHRYKYSHFSDTMQELFCMVIKKNIKEHINRQTKIFLYYKKQDTFNCISFIMGNLQNLTSFAVSKNIVQI